VSAAQAARLALTEAAPERTDDVEPVELARISIELVRALDRLDEPGAQASLDRLLATFTLQTVLRDVVLPYLHELGERWECGEASVAQEHFASNLLRGRLLGLARGWGGGAGPRAVLACAPGELHDLPLIVFGLVLAGRGWVITYLGPDTPLATIQETVADLDARLVVISALTKLRFRATEPQLTELVRQVPVALAGAGATERLARATGALLLDEDPVTAAERVADDLR
jgi:methanogenic corrinoid protein MtbC1